MMPFWALATDTNELLPIFSDDAMPFVKIDTRFSDQDDALRHLEYDLLENEDVVGGSLRAYRPDHSSSIFNHYPHTIRVMYAY